MKKKNPRVQPVPAPSVIDEVLEIHLDDASFPRSEELNRLLAAYRDGTNPLWICGAPGSGKTLLAKEVAWEISRKNAVGRWKHSAAKIFFLPFRGSIRETIRRYDIPLYMLLPVSG